MPLACSDTFFVTYLDPPRTATRDHWVNTVVGVLDSAFYLSPEEQLAAAQIVTALLNKLHIPARGIPKTLPMPLVQEVHANYYSTALEAVLSGRDRSIRAVSGNDCYTSLEAWRTGIESMFALAYPDLTGPERMLLAKVVNDLLAAIGVPNRAASYFPEMVLRAHKEIGEY